MTTILPAVATWQYQPAANTLPVPAVPVAGWLNGVAPFGHASLIETEYNPQTEWAPDTALWMRRTVTLPEGSDFIIRVVIENSCFVYWDGELVGEVNPTNVQIDTIPELFIPLTVAQTAPGDHVLVLFCLDEEAVFTPDATYVSVEVIQPAIVTQVAEEGVSEELLWVSDLQVSFNGTETVESLVRYPKRTFFGSLAFDNEADLRRHLAIMFKESAELYYLPAFPYLTKLKASVSIGENFVLANTARSDFRVGSLAIVLDGSSYEVFMVAAITSDSVTFVNSFTKAFSARAMVCPLVEVYSVSPISINRKNIDHDAIVDFRAHEHKPWIPFVSPENEADLTLFDGLPVLEQIPFGDSFESTLQSGIIAEAFLNLPALASPWLQAKRTFNFRFLCNRIWNLDTWLWWKVFLDYCQGAKNEFLFPTNRADLAVVTPAVGAGATVTVAGHDYRTSYWGLDTFKRIAIHSDAGTHYASITAAAINGDNDQLTFSPALPAGAGWNSNQKISFLLKSRLASDKVVFEHYGLRTEISLSVRTAQ